MSNQMMVSKSFVKFCQTWGLDLPKITNEHLRRGTKIGKILKRELLMICKQRQRSTYALDNNVKDGTMAWYAKTYADRIQYAESADDIAAIYNNQRIRSCMTEEGDKLGEFYAANNVKVAYLTNDFGELSARCLISSCGFVKAYGPAREELYVGLQELGIKSAPQIFKPGMKIELPESKDGNCYIPYLDKFNKIMIKHEDGALVTNVNGLSFDKIRYSDLDYIEGTIDRLQELIDAGHKWEISGQRHEVQVGEGIHYVLDEACLVPLTKLLAEYKKTAEVVREPEIKRLWDLVIINGRLMWVFKFWDEIMYWETNTGYMDDYGNFVDEEYCDSNVRIEIPLNELGIF